MAVLMMQPIGLARTLLTREKWTNLWLSSACHVSAIARRDSENGNLLSRSPARVRLEGHKGRRGRLW